MNKIFKFEIITNGNLISSFVFENENEVNRWISEDLQLLKEKYGNINFKIRQLSPLKIGDYCHVCGEGFDIFKIEGQVLYSKDRYGFVLDTGFSEEVGKCYKKEQSCEN